MLQFKVRLEKSKNDKTPSGDIRRTIIRNVDIPLATIKKGARDTIKPYKSTRQLADDILLQPFYGIGNILRATFEIGVAPFYFIANLLMTPFKPKNKKFSYFADSTSLLLVTLTSNLFKMTHGVLQITAWPFTILRSMVRGFLNVYKGREAMENRDSFKKLLTQYNSETSGTTKTVLSEIIYYKVKRALTEKHRIDLDKEKLAEANKASTADNQAKPLVDFLQTAHASQTPITDSTHSSPVPF